jgi:hypothetical protein
VSGYWWEDRVREIIHEEASGSGLDPMPAPSIPTTKQANSAIYWRERCDEARLDLRKALTAKNQEQHKRKAVEARLEGMLKLEESLTHPGYTTPQVLDLLIGNLQRIRSRITDV